MSSSLSATIIYTVPRYKWCSACSLISFSGRQRGERGVSRPFNTSILLHPFKILEGKILEGPSPCDGIDYNVGIPVQTIYFCTTSRVQKQSTAQCFRYGCAPLERTLKDAHHGRGPCPGPPPHFWRVHRVSSDTRQISFFWRLEKVAVFFL